MSNDAHAINQHYGQADLSTKLLTALREAGKDLEAMTRGGRLATEWLWFNYQKPHALHDYRYLGEDFRERERIKRKKQRWVKRLKMMPHLERYALLSAIREVWPPALSPETAIPAETMEISLRQK